MTMSSYRIIISAIWWGLGLGLLAWMFAASSEPATFGSYVTEARDWIIPHVVPTMTLTGVVALMQSTEGDVEPNRQIHFAFLLTVVISIFYLALVGWATHYSIQGMFGESERGSVDGLYSWNRILGVIQGLAASAIGVFFVKSGKTSSPPPE